MDDSSFLDEFLAPPSRPGLRPSDTPINVRKGLPVKAAVDTSLESRAPRQSLILPDDLQSRLFSHQKEGVRWLHKKHCTARAGLLADEMGLGKTIQVCTFLGQLYRDQKIKTTIIIVPVSLIGVWKEALKEWGRIPDRQVEVIHQESKEKRRVRWKRLSYTKCVLLTTYGVLRQDATDMSATMVDYVVLDEAHLIKDPSTNAFQSALLLSARHKIALTGTPVMNSFEDMWSLFRFLDGSIISLEKSDFQTISKTLLRGNERDASEREKQCAGEELGKLQALIRPFMLRREKKEVEGVKAVKHDSVVWIRLSEVQEQQYHAFLGTTEVKGALQKESTSNPLVLLTSLSQICVHPWLNLTDEGFREAMRHPHQSICPELGNISSSTKLGVTVSLLKKALEDNRKTLVFSRSRRLLHMLGVLLTEASIVFARFDGDLSPSERHQAVADFNDAPTVKVCLLTTQVGGVGLTFTSASCVILMDPSWNPSADAQAVDRVHRIGQDRDVQVFRLISAGTVEEKVYRNQIFKRMAAKQIAKEDNSELYRYFTKLQLRSMFEVGDLEHSETAAQLEELHPGRVADSVKWFTAGIPDVLSVSDDGCVLSEEVVAEEDVVETTTSSPPPGPSLKRSRSRTTSAGGSPPPCESRKRKGDDEDVSELEDIQAMWQELSALSSQAQPTSPSKFLPEEDVTDGEKGLEDKPPNVLIHDDTAQRNSLHGQSSVNEMERPVVGADTNASPLFEDGLTVPPETKVNHVEDQHADRDGSHCSSASFFSAVEE